MDKYLKGIFATLFVAIPILVLVFLSFRSELLIPAGYNLAIDGYVVSRTLVIISTLYFISKAGYCLYESINRIKE